MKLDYSDVILAHTGQNYNLNGVFFCDLVVK